MFPNTMICGSDVHEQSELTSMSKAIFFATLKAVSNLLHQLICAALKWIPGQTLFVF